jgi:DNA-binding transcriptional LysR family regulator
MILASPDYIKKYGMPQKPEDLDKHRLIVYGADGRAPVRNVNWLMELGTRPGVERRPVFTVNNAYAILRGMESGLGIAALPDFMLPDTHGLVRILPEAPTAEIEAYFVYPEELRSSKRIAVFRDFLLRKVAEAKNG